MPEIEDETETLLNMSVDDILFAPITPEKPKTSHEEDEMFDYHD